MTAITTVTPEFSVAPALSPPDFDQIATLGFRTVINNRVDGEEPGKADMRAAAEAAGLVYRHVPASKLELFTEPVVTAMLDALRSAPQPILAYCASGTRSAIVWAAASARQRPVLEILGLLESAGFNLGFLRDDLDSQADRARWSGGVCLADTPAPAPGARDRAAA